MADNPVGVVGAGSKVGGILSGVGGVLGGLGSLAGAFGGASSAKRLQDDMQRWQRKMYQKRYQFTVKDMLKAGINPIMAAELGGGGTPSAPMGAPLSQDTGSRAISSAMEVARGIQDLRLSASQARKNDSDSALADSQTKVNWWKYKEGEARNPTLGKRIDAELREIEARIHGSSARAFRDREDAGRVTFPGGLSLPGGMVRPVGAEIENFLNSAAGLTRR